MIPLNDISSVDFLTREQVEELLKMGVNMSDARYAIANVVGIGDVVVLKKKKYSRSIRDVVPTYTIKDFLKKMTNVDYSITKIFEEFKENYYKEKMLGNFEKPN